jgi:SH3-like domain-containing protein
VTGLPVPRFVSLKAEEANLRVGPGVRYPIQWVLVRRGLPLMVTDEYGHWRKVREPDGAEGWVHKNLLSGQRTVLVVGETRSLHSGPDTLAPAVLLAEPGVQGHLSGCEGTWCRVEIAGRSGWLPGTHVWGIAGGGEAAPPAHPLDGIIARAQAATGE